MLLILFNGSMGLSSFYYTWAQNSLLRVLLLSYPRGSILARWCYDTRLLNPEPQNSSIIFSRSLEVLWLYRSMVLACRGSILSIIPPNNLELLSSFYISNLILWLSICSLILFLSYVSHLLL